MEVETIADPPEEVYGPVRPPKAPGDFLIGASGEGRMRDFLRDAAKAKDPHEILVRATVELFRAEPGTDDLRLAEAVADLAVTGRYAYAAYVRQLPDAARVASDAGTRLGLAGDERLGWFAERLIARADKVRVYLRQDARGRAHLLDTDAELRGWVDAGLAVVGEEDPPHRPVNVGMTPYAQHDVTLRCQGRPVDTRYVVAGPLDGSTRVVLLLHGHSSRAEEGDDLIAALRAVRDERGRRRYSVVAVDLPSCGYAQMLDHVEVAPIPAPDHLATDFPVLDFLDDFVIQFVETLSERSPLKQSLALVGGGSLGGNLSLRLAERGPAWLRRIASWSAASVWSEFGVDAAQLLGVDTCYNRMAETETEASRRDYFRQVFDDRIPLAGVTQPEAWYRGTPDFAEVKASMIASARIERQEIYHPRFRRWHWRVAYEQLRFSHVHPVAHWEKIRVPCLLLGGRLDDFHWTNIYSRMRDLGQNLATREVPGRTLLLEHTGHSVHSERPKLLAEAIDHHIRSTGS